MIDPNYGRPWPTLLRDHPLMSYRGIRSWPPTWTWVAGPANKYAHGEVGILKSVALSKTLPANRCFLYVDHQGSSYVGCLIVDDQSFCREIVKTVAGLLQSFHRQHWKLRSLSSPIDCDCPVADIG